MADKNEEISNPAGAADRLDQRTFPESEIFPTSRKRLTPREREIAITAVSARAAGSPVEAAKQVLAAIAVLDGCHSPILVWPENMTRSEKATWHAAEAVYWQDSDRHLKALMPLEFQSAARTQPLNQADSSTGEPGQPHPLSASAAEAPHAEEQQNPPRSELVEPVRASSDAC